MRCPRPSAMGANLRPFGAARRGWLPFLWRSGAFVNCLLETISLRSFSSRFPHPTSALYGAPPSIGRREKSQSLSLEGKCVSNRWKMRVPLSPYCHFERSEKSSLHTGQTKEVRGAVNTVLHTTWNDGLPHMHCFPACKKDPPAALGMTKRGTGCLTFHLIPLREPTSAPIESAFP